MWIIQKTMKSGESKQHFIYCKTFKINTFDQIHAFLCHEMNIGSTTLKET